MNDSIPGGEHIQFKASTTLRMSYRKSAYRTVKFKCKEVLVTQRYGGGLRYHCPVCDTSDRSISWTNGAPPKVCGKTRTRSELR